MRPLVCYFYPTYAGAYAGLMDEQEGGEGQYRDCLGIIRHGIIILLEDGLSSNCATLPVVFCISSIQGYSFRRALESLESRTEVLKGSLTKHFTLRCVCWYN